MAYPGKSQSLFDYFMAPYSIKIITVGQMATNCYIVWDRVTLDGIIIDAGDDAEYISDTLNQLRIFPRAVIATHGHFDHVLAAFALESMYNIPFMMNPADSFLLKNMNKSATHFLHVKHVDPPPRSITPLLHGQHISLGKSEITVMETPGHTPGSVCLYEQQHRVIFTGDTIFASGALGRTDRTYGNRNQLMESVKRLLALPSNTALFPGHGDASTIGAEKSQHVV